MFGTVHDSFKTHYVAVVQVQVQPFNRANYHSTLDKRERKQPQMLIIRYRVHCYFYMLRVRKSFRYFNV